MSKLSPSVQNLILRSFSPAGLAVVMPRLHRVRLSRRLIAQEMYSRVYKVLFIESGLISVVVDNALDGGLLPIGVVGRSGLVGLPAVLGTMRSPHRYVVEIAGEALQISASDIAHAMECHPDVRNRLMNYIQALLVQSTQVGMCNVRHPLGQRLARWLLLTSDRLVSATVPLTHETIASMLGVRRAGITVELAQLEAAAAIKKCRGAVIIADRNKLEQHACGCYRVIANEYEQMYSFDRSLALRQTALSPLYCRETISGLKAGNRIEA
jgi:CRP-like cAMP-binding protein